MIRKLLPLLIILGAGCASKKEMTLSRDGEWTYFMRRNGCYGTCPIYEVEIDSDGSMRYVGERFVDPLGNATGSVSEADMDSLVMTLNALNYQALEDEYTCSASDLPITEFVLVKNGEKKKVIYRCEGPEELPQLARLTDRITRRNMD
ncbi:MAG: DUF6438 domain-containing protein [Bacteroidota bacterium]|nr:DUF6438 domain-containing protein [Bacteroidota bacterium]MDX5447364.1 DUF6438 domain-containing protein [Bacteroidota bacterium]